MYSHEIKANIQNTFPKEFFELPWVKELSEKALSNPEYFQAHLYFFYKNKEDAEEALEICKRRRFLTDKSGIVYNRKEDSYSVILICQLLENQILPRCNQTWQQATYD